MPEELRGIGIRIEDDILCTPEGAVNLSAGLPREAERGRILARRPASRRSAPARLTAVAVTGVTLGGKSDAREVAAPYGADHATPAGAGSGDPGQPVRHEIPAVAGPGQRPSPDRLCAVLRPAGSVRWR